MGKGKNRSPSGCKKARASKSIVVHITYQEGELLACKTEEELDSLFNTKVENAMHNFKIDVKKFFGFGRKSEVVSPKKGS